MSKLLGYLVQRFCLHDGPGIRTNVFLKGCTLACKWCQNPESIKNEVELSFDHAKCIGCSACSSACDKNAILFDLEQPTRRIDPDLCDLCGDCVVECPSGAIELLGEFINVEELVNELLLDRSFYDATSGGVTITGGEPLLQAEELVPLLKALKEEEVHVLIESCAAVPWSSFESVVPYVDEFFIDFKGSEDLYKELTGGSYSVVVKNLEKLLKEDVPVTVRMPVVPGMNDGEDCIMAMSEELKRMGVEEVHLLEYHRMYQNKIEKLVSTEQEVLEVIPDENSVVNVGAIMEDFGINVVYPEVFKQEDLDYSLLPERIYEVKDIIENTEREICTERVSMMTEWYRDKENFAKHPLIGRAEVLAWYLNEKTNKIYDEDFFVGNHTSKRISGPIFYELHGIGVVEDVFKFEKRELNPFKISGKEKWELIKNYPFWLQKNVNALAFDGKLLKILQKKSEWQKVDDFFLNETSGFSHLNPDYANLLSKGTRKIAEEARDMREQTDDPDRKKYYTGVEIMCEGLEGWANCYADIAEEMIKTEELSKERKKELKEIARICRKVPAEPVESIHEALQSILFYHLGIMNEALDNGVCPGRLDYVLYPYYLMDKQRGLSDDEIRETFAFFFLKLNEPVPVFNEQITSVHGGMFSGQTVNVGGVDMEGNDVTNELSHMLLDIQNLLRMRQPNFYARVHENSPKDYVLKIASMLRDGTTTPAISNDEVIIEQLVQRGMDIEHARDYILCGCVEPISCGRTYGSTDTSLNNLPLCMERALGSKKGGCTNEKSSSECKNIEEVFELYVHQVDHLLKQMHSDQVRIEQALQDYYPTPLTSMCLDGTMQTGMDASAGGVVYNASGNQGIGPADVADSLAAIERLVFEEKLCSMDELVTALKKNFEGEERIYQLCVNSPKYGNDDPRADKWMDRVVRSYSDLLTSRFNLRGGQFLAGWYSVTIHKGFGLKTGALPSGRLSGYPLSNGLGPANGADLMGPTAICNSLTSFDTIPYSGNGLNLNLTLDTSYLEGEKGVETVAGLITGYFKNKGHQVQFNILDPMILVDAKENPHKYPNLLVRVSGYSSYWRDLDPLVQQDIIDRYLGQISREEIQEKLFSMKERC